MLAATGAVLIALSGCGGGGGHAATPTASASVDQHNAQREDALAFSKCMRENGRPDFPDPVQGAKGGWVPPEGTVIGDPPPACRDAADRLRQDDQSGDRVSAADMAKLRQFAACMREKYPQFPDPDARGDFVLPQSLVAVFNDAPRGQDNPTVRCERFMPQGMQPSIVG